MRAFNDREKDIIRLLNTIDISNIEGLSFFLQNQYFTESRDQAIFLIRQYKRVFLFIPESRYLNREQQKREIYTFLELLSLIKYLKENRYIDIVLPTNDVLTPDMHMMRQAWVVKVENEGTANNKIIINDKLYIDVTQFDHIFSLDGQVRYRGIRFDESVYNDVMIYLMGIPLVNDELRQLEKNNFKNSEEIKFERTHTIAKWALIVAIVVGIFSIISSIFLMCEKNAKKSSEVKVEMPCKLGKVMREI